MAVNVTGHIADIKTPWFMTRGEVQSQVRGLDIIFGGFPENGQIALRYTLTSETGGQLS